MRKKILIFLIILAVIFSLLSLWPRYKIEKVNRDVELVYDQIYLTELAEKVGEEQSNLLELFKKNGLTGVAVYPTSFKTLIDSRDARLITANQLDQFRLIFPDIHPVYNKFSSTDQSVFIAVENKDIREQVSEKLFSWEKEYGIDTSEMDNKLVLFFREWDSKYNNLALGFSQEYIEAVENIGLTVIPRLDNKIIGYNQFEIFEDTGVDLVIFSGEEILGYPEKLAETAKIIHNNHIKYGMIEPFIADQKGSTHLAQLLDYNLVRVHSLEQEEMDKSGQEKIINRYLRAVRERDVRVLYLKPFLDEENGDLLTANVQFINKLTERLTEEGYNIAGAQPYNYFNNSLLYLIIVGYGIFAGGIILLGKLWKRELNVLFYILIFLVTAGEIVFILRGQVVLLRQILALGSSIIFPTLAVITGIEYSRKELWPISFLRVIGVSFLGILFMTAGLSELSFLLKVNQFRGVKLAFLFPLLLISYYFYREFIINRENTNLAEISVNLLEIEIKIKHVLLLFIIAVGGIIYIGRSGNYPILPVPAWEITLRELLEKYLFIRPRFKAFLFGHPFLVLILALKYNNKYKLLFYPAVLMAVIGQITVLNTFSHIHTPLQVSLIRFVNGVWLGLLIGIILLVVISILSLLKEKFYA